MPATLTSRSKAVVATDSQLLGEVQAAFGSFAKAIASRVSSVIVDFEQTGGSAKALAKSVEQAMPKLFEQQFQALFLVDKESARRQRALLTHLLSTVELQSTGRKGKRAGSVPSQRFSAGVEGAQHREITSEQAAKLLHVSRTHVNTLVDSGALGTVRLTTGGHRRLSEAAVLRYKEQSKARQSRGLENMVDATRRLRLYDAELAGVPERRKR